MIDNIARFPLHKARALPAAAGVVTSRPAATAAAPGKPVFSSAGEGESAGVAPPPMHPLFLLAESAVSIARDAASGEFPEKVANAAQQINRELLIIAVHEHDVSLFRAVSLLAINLTEVSERDSERAAHWMLTLPNNMLLVRDLLALTKLKAGL